MKTAGITSQTHGVKAEKGRESKGGTLKAIKTKRSSPCTDNHYHSKYLCKERKKCTGAAVLPVRRNRGKVERSGGKTVMLAMPPACPRRSQSRRGLRCLVPASRSSDQPSISTLSIHPQADYSVITHTLWLSLPANASTRSLPASLSLESCNHSHVRGRRLIIHSAQMVQLPPPFLSPLPKRRSTT